MVKTKISKKILFGIPLALLSFQIYIGIVLGYFFGKFFGGKKPGQLGTIKSIIVNFGNYRLHIHHWLLSLSILISNFAFDFSLPFRQFSLAFLGGLVLQGILCYSDWHRIVVRR